MKNKLKFSEKSASHTVEEIIKNAPVKKTKASKEKEVLLKSIKEKYSK